MRQRIIHPNERARAVCAAVVLMLALAVFLPGVRANGLSAEDVKSARQIYEVKCAKCHKFYEPTSYRQPEWDEWMVQMARKSKLKPEQTRMLTEFLNDYRQRGRVGRP